MIRSLDGHTGPVYSLNFNNSSTLVSTGSADQTVYVWDTSDGSVVWRYKTTASIHEVSFRHDGRVLAFCTSDSKVLSADLAYSVELAINLFHFLCF
jgi:WD40 repeat protein